MVKEFAVMIAHGPYRAWLGAEATTAKRAEREACGIVEAGGNVWEGFSDSPCPKGDMPDEFLDSDEFNEGYEVLGVFEVSKWRHTFEYLRALEVIDQWAA